jgi:hypothetical protein
MKGSPPNIVFLITTLLASHASADTNSVGSVSPSDKAFFEQIQTAVLADDVEWFANAISYPILIRMNKEEFPVADKEAFKRHAKLVFSNSLKSTLRRQSRDSLFKNWQGIMIGRGEIWFSQVVEKTKGKDWVYRVIAMNPSDPDK